MTPMNEHAALLRPIGTLDSDKAKPSEPARRYMGREAVLPARGGEAQTEAKSSGQRMEQSRAAAKERRDTKR
jgi:hypothetical protein